MGATTRPADAGLGWPFCVPCSCPFAFPTDPSCASLMGSVLGLEAGTDDGPLSWEDLELLPARGLPGWVPCLCEAVREGSLEEAASELGSGGGDRCSRGEREPTGLCSRSLAGRRASEERRRPKGPGGPHLGSSVSSKRSLQLLRDLGPLLCLSVPWFPHLQSRRGDVTAPAAACENSGNYCCKALRTVPDASEHPRPSGISMALIPSPPLFFQGDRWLCRVVQIKCCLSPRARGQVTKRAGAVPHACARRVISPVISFCADSRIL